MKKLSLVVTFLIYFTLCHGLVIESIVGLGTSIATAWLFNKGYCRLKECCTDRWTNSPNITGLQTVLRNRVFGQHLVTDTVFKAVKGHVLNKTPSKALALSFNGCSGCGKNFVSEIIAKHLFRKAAGLFHGWRVVGNGWRVTGKGWAGGGYYVLGSSTRQFRLIKIAVKTVYILTSTNQICQGIFTIQNNGLSCLFEMRFPRS